VEIGEGVSMEFTGNGELIYALHQEDKVQLMSLTYRVSNAYLITDQPSSRREERTRFRFESDDVLVLEYEGAESWFQRS